jgi:hypothetical protein
MGKKSRRPQRTAVKKNCSSASNGGGNKKDEVAAFDILDTFISQTLNLKMMNAILHRNY